MPQLETVAVSDFLNGGRHLNGYPGRSALLLQHVHYVAGGAVAKELAQRFLMPGNVVLLDQLQEIGRSVAGQRGLGKVRIGREEVFGGGVQVGEVAAAASGDQDLLADAICMLQQENTTTAATGMHGAEQAGGAGAHNQARRRAALNPASPMGAFAGWARERGRS